MRFIFPMTLFVGVVVLAACDTKPDTEIVNYRCGAMQLSATLSDDKATLRFGEQNVVLTAEPAAAGMRYFSRDHELEFWRQGDEAQLTIAQQPYPLCIDENTLPTTLSARGNEPFWLVQRRLNSASLRRPNGDRDFQNIELRSVETSPSRQWEIRLDTTTTLYISDQLCRDSMSGMPHPYTAELNRDSEQLSGCAGEPRQLITGVSWQLHGSNLDSPPHIQFMPDQTVFGYAGCNRFHGHYDLSGESLTFKPLATTKMMCAPEQMAVEAQFLEALQDVS